MSGESWVVSIAHLIHHGKRRVRKQKLIDSDNDGVDNHFGYDKDDADDDNDGDEDDEDDDVKQ